MKPIQIRLLQLTLLAALLSAFCLQTAPAQEPPPLSSISPPPTGGVEAQWVYPTNLVFSFDTNLVFKLYTTTDIVVANYVRTNSLVRSDAPGMSQVWTLAQVLPFSGFTNGLLVVGSNYQFTAKLKITPGLHFFALTVSNKWGESVFSNVDWMNPLPLVDNKMSVRRAD